MGKQILDSVFRAYDIRGKYPSELDSDFYRNLGKAYVTYFKPKKVAVGYDMRSSSPALKNSLIQGLIEMGCDVVDLGEIATELLYFAVARYEDIFDGGFIVTASHNDAGWNGCKLVGKKSNFIGATTGLIDLKNIILENKYEVESGNKGSISELSIADEYKKKVLSFITSKNRKPLKIVVDAGNGMGGKLFDFIFGELDLNVTRLYFDHDGNFPNHIPNPMEEENVEELKKLVVESGADFGIATDGDADRAFFIDKKGRKPSGAYTGVILANFLLNKSPDNRKIVHDTKIVWPFVREADNLDAEMCQSVTGRQNFKASMDENNALFGVEASSHYYYHDFYNCDSGMITIAQMINMYFEGFELTKSVDYLFEKYPNSGEVNYRVENPVDLIHKIEEFYGNQGAKIEKIDGLSVEFDDWRFNLRTSNTQPLLRLNLEATTKEKVVEKFLEVERMIGAVRDNLPALEELR